MKLYILVVLCFFIAGIIIGQSNNVLSYEVLKDCLTFIMSAIGLTIAYSALGTWHKQFKYTAIQQYVDKVHTCFREYIEAIHTHYFDALRLVNDSEKPFKPTELGSYSKCQKCYDNYNKAWKRSPSGVSYDKNSKFSPSNVNKWFNEQMRDLLYKRETSDPKVHESISTFSVRAEDFGEEGEREIDKLQPDFPSSFKN